MARTIYSIITALLIAFAIGPTGVNVYAEGREQNLEADSLGETAEEAESSDEEAVYPADTIANKSFESEISAKAGKLSDITNFNELANDILWLSAPLYLEESLSNPISLNAYGWQNLYSKVTKYKSLDDMRSYYENHFSDTALNKLARFTYEFAVYQNQLYFADSNVGYSGFAPERARLDRVADNGDYIVSIPKYANISMTGTPDYYVCAFRKKNGKFYIADFLSIPNALHEDPVIGYAVVNANGMYSYAGRSTSSAKQQIYNKGAIIDVYEIVRSGKNIWYRCTTNNNQYITTAWIPDSGNNIKFTSWIKNTTFLNAETIEIYAGDTVKLTPEILLGSQTVSWTSSNKAIASVDKNGSVKGIKPGTVTIKASLSGGSQSSCKLRVLFTDIAKKQYYYDPVYWAVGKGITNGYTDSDNVVRTFKPQNNCTREAVVTFLWRLAGKPEPRNLKSSFTDVQDTGKYYYKAVLWAAEQGITKGYSDGSFKPNNTCLREHVVTFLWRYAKQPAPKSSKNPFNDIRSTDYYYKAVLWANEKGIAKGYTTGANKGGFGPKLDCLREHVVTFLYRYAKQ